MTGANFYTYVLQVFKRTNYSTEVYQSVTDTIRDMKRRFDYDEAKVEKDTTDTISVLGDYKIDLEDDFGRLIGAVLVQDGTRSYDLEMLSKEEFDRRYPNPAGSGVSRGRPQAACVFGGQILIGPAPDSVAYEYHHSYSEDDGATVVAGTDPVPFSDTYPETLRHGTLSRLFGDVLKMQDLGVWHERKYEEGLVKAEARERKNTAGRSRTRYQGT